VQCLCQATYVGPDQCALYLLADMVVCIPCSPLQGAQLASAKALLAALGNIAAGGGDSEEEGAAAAPKRRKRAKPAAAAGGSKRLRGTRPEQGDELESGAADKSSTAKKGKKDKKDKKKTKPATK